MSVTWTWHGAVTPTSVWVRARVSGTSAELLVSQDSDLSGAATFGPVTPDAVDMASLQVTGLEPSTRYHYRWVIDSVEEPDFDGTFLTAPPDDGSPQSFIVGAAGDAGLVGDGAGDPSHITDGVSNNPLFDTMAARSTSEGWLAFHHLGDFFYRDGQSTALSHFRDTYDDVHTFNGAEGAEARQGRFYRGVNMTLGMDDHDLMANNTDRTSAGRDPALTVYRESAPHYRLPAGDGADGIYQSWQHGRVLFLQSDVRAYRDPNTDRDIPSKTMLGSLQKHWMEGVLRNSEAEALVWIMPSIWMSDVGEKRDAGLAFSGSDYSGDSWWRFSFERDELIEMLGDHGWLGRMVQLTADKHALSIASGPANPYGHFPVFQFASMDSNYQINPEGQYDIGQSGGRQRYGTLRVVDSGHTIALHGTGYINDTVWRSYTAYAHAGSRVLALDYAAGQVTPPMDPTDDDQRTINDFTASRRDGGERRREQTDGPMGTQDPPEGVGRYTGSETYEVFTDDQAADQAGWRVHRGTVDAARYPEITVDLTNPRMADLRPGAAGLDAGDRIEVDNPPSFLPPGRIDLTVEGYSETFGEQGGWEITYQASPASPLRVARVAPSVVLNPNPHFDVGTAGWEAVGSDLERVVDHTVRGLGAALQTPDGTSEVSRTRTRLDDSPRVYAGREYTFAAWVRSADGHDVDMSVQWITADGLSIAFPFILPAESIPAGTWTQVTGSAVAPEAAHHVRWNISQRDTPAATDELRIDEAYMTDGPSLTPDGPDRAHTEGSTLLEAVDDTETELVVATTQDEFGGQRWINTEGPTLTHPHAVPVDLAVGPETVRVTGIRPAGWDVMRRATPAGTWGTAESGHDWVDTAVADTNLGVVEADQYGFIQLSADETALRIQRLDLGLDIADCEVLWSVRTNVTSSGAAQLPGLVLRHESDTDFYIAEARLSPAGNVNLHLRRGTTAIGEIAFATTYTPSSDLGDRIFIRTRIIGHRILCRAWKHIYPGMDGLGDGLDTRYQEPHHWHLDREIPEEEGRIEAGGMGFAGWVSSGNTNTNPSLRFQLLSIETPQRMTVTRAVNDMPAAHEAGTAVALSRPAPVGL